MHAVNVLARSVTKWTRACDRRLHRLISCLHHTSHLVLTCFIGDEVKDLKLALYSDASFADDLSSSKSVTGGYLALVGPRTFVPLTWLCKKQTAVAHSSTESEIIALDTCLRVEGIPALNFLDTINQILDPQNSEVDLKIGPSSIWDVDFVPEVKSGIPRRAK